MSSGKIPFSVSDSEWNDLRNSVSALQTAVIALTVVIVIFCILQLISFVYKSIVMRRKAHEQKKERMQIKTAKQKSELRRTESLSSSTRRRAKKHRKSKMGEPSKNAIVRLSLSHEDDQPKESRKLSKERGGYRKSQHSLEDSAKVKRSVKIALQPDGIGSGEIAPEKRAAFGKCNTKWPIGKRIVSPQRDKKFLSTTNDNKINTITMMAESEKSRPVDSSMQMANVQDSLMVATVPPKFVAVPNKELDKSNKMVLKTAELNSESRAQDKETSKFAPQNCLQGSDPVVTAKGQDNNLFPNDKEGIRSAKPTEANGSASNDESASSKKRPIVVEIPENVASSGPQATVVKEGLPKADENPVETVNPRSASSESSKSTKNSANGKRESMSGKVLEFTIGV